MRSFRHVLTPGVLVEEIGTVQCVSVRQWRGYLGRKSAYMRPRCDETCLRRLSPNSTSFSDGSVFMNSFSSSCVGSQYHLSQAAEI